MEIWIIFLISFLNYWLGFFIGQWFKKRPVTVGSILITEIPDLEDPYLLLELDDSPDTFMQLDNISLRVVNQVRDKNKA